MVQAIARQESDELGFGPLSQSGIGGVRGALLDGEEKFTAEMLSRFTIKEDLYEEPSYTQT